MRAWLLGLAALATVGSALAGPVPLELVSGSDELAGLQVQRPIWAPGDTPRLVHEASDRSRRGLLRVVSFGADPVVIPGTRSTRLAALGAGAERADGAAAWWDGQGFFFVRSSSGIVSAQYWDGVLRDLAAPSGRPVTIARAPGDGLYVTMEDARGLDLFLFGGTDLATEPQRLTATAEAVEHSVTVLPDGIAFIATTREGTRLMTRTGGRVAPVSLPVRDELLSLAGVGDGRLLAWVSRAGSTDHALLLLDPAAGEASALVTDGYLPPGLAPRPAVSPSGWVYYVQSAADAANPVVRLRLDDGRRETLELATSGHQEVAVASYPSAAGPIDWLAVVAVGDLEGDVANHLYVGAMRQGAE